MHEEAFSPELAVYFADKLKAECGIQLPKPQFIQGSLFDQFSMAGRS
jgi:hypothetical protein